MAVVGNEEALERMRHYFHGAMRNVPGHSVSEQNCWACMAAAYAVVTPTERQKPKSDFALRGEAA